MDNLLDIFNLLDYVHHFDGCEKVLLRLLHMEDQNVSENSFLMIQFELWHLYVSCNRI